jgi:hypothetical protein
VRKRKKLWLRKILFRSWGMAQVVEHLLSKCKAIVPSPGPPPKQTKPPENNRNPNPQPKP